MENKNKFYLKLKPFVYFTDLANNILPPKIDISIYNPFLFTAMNVQFNIEDILNIPHI